MLQHRPSQGSRNAKIPLKPTLQLARYKSEDIKESEEEEDDDGGLLRRKAFSIVRPEVKTKLETSGRKLLEVVLSEEEGEEESDHSDDSSSVEEKKENQKAVVGNISAKVCWRYLQFSGVLFST